VVLCRQARVTVPTDTFAQILRHHPRSPDLSGRFASGEIRRCKDHQGTVQITVRYQLSKGSSSQGYLELFAVQGDISPLVVVRL
jgi:hypothetical protein